MRNMFRVTSFQSLKQPGILRYKTGFHWDARHKLKLAVGWLMDALIARKQVAARTQHHTT
jgi:hypothetical protein